MPHNPSFEATCHGRVNRINSSDVAPGIAVLRAVLVQVGVEVLALRGVQCGKLADDNLAQATDLKSLHRPIDAAAKRHA